jgi:hypothetical protein
MFISPIKKFVSRTEATSYGMMLPVAVSAIPHKEHLTILHVICLHIFRHLAQKSFDRRQPACMIFAQSDKKSDYASDAQSLCGVAYQLLSKGNVIRRHHSDH